MNLRPVSLGLSEKDDRNLLLGFRMEQNELVLR